jgi:type VI secretion system protein ImpA
MTLPGNILSPIPGVTPSGQNLRYDSVYEKVKEARREEEDLPQGEWSRVVKTADPVQVIRLTTEALTTKTKDLQLAAWLTEALLRQEGIGGLREGLDLLRGLIANFWDTVYPEAEDGDVELRVAPLNWIGTYLDDQVRRTPLTRSRYDWFRYLESRAIAYEEACAGNEAKMSARQTAIGEKKLTPEAFDQDMNATSREFYVQFVNDLEQAQASLRSLDDLCTEKIGRDGPNFGKLRSALEDVQSLVGTFLRSKEEPEPEEPEEPAEVASAPAAVETPSAPARKRAAAGEPVDREDAICRIIAAATFLRRLEPCNPAPYLVLRGLRWGEGRARGLFTAIGNLVAPPSETRQALKHLAREAQWNELLEASEGAMAQSYGMAWLDLQRYSIRACEEMGSDYDAVAGAIRSVLRALLIDIPELSQLVFVDDTPVANPETVAWLHEISNSSNGLSGNANAAKSLDETPARFEEQTPDAQEVAMQAARSGRIQEAMEILTREMAQERSGRARFERRLQLASICLATGHEPIAYPILKELAQEIERRKLEEWELPSAVANSLTLLFRCLNQMGGDAIEKQEIYQRICRLDPLQALACLKQ